MSRNNHKGWTITLAISLALIITYLAIQLANARHTIQRSAEGISVELTVAGDECHCIQVEVE